MPASESLGSAARGTDADEVVRVEDLKVHFPL